MSLVRVYLVIAETGGTYRHTNKNFYLEALRHNNIRSIVIIIIIITSFFLSTIRLMQTTTGLRRREGINQGLFV